MVDIDSKQRLVGRGPVPCGRLARVCSDDKYVVWQASRPVSGCVASKQANVGQECQAFPDPSYAVRVLAVPASFAYTHSDE